MNEGTAWLIFILSLGVGFTTASLTPGVHGPGYIAFAATFLIVDIVWTRWIVRRSKR